MRVKRVKTFYGMQGVSFPDDDINSWLKDNPDVNIINITQSNDKEWLYITVLYESEKENDRIRKESI